MTISSFSAFSFIGSATPGKMVQVPFIALPFPVTLNIKIFGFANASTPATIAEGGGGSGNIAVAPNQIFDVTNMGIFDISLLDGRIIQVSPTDLSQTWFLVIYTV